MVYGPRASDGGGSAGAGDLHADRRFRASVSGVRHQAKADVRGELAMFSSVKTDMLARQRPPLSCRTPLPPGERSAVITTFANLQRRKSCVSADTASLPPRGDVRQDSEARLSVEAVESGEGRYA